MARFAAVALLAFVVGIGTRYAAAGTECRPAATPTAGALSFAGDAGDTVTEPFRLEEGTTLLTVETDGSGFPTFSLNPAPGSEAGAGWALTPRGGPYRGTTLTRVYDAGDFVIAVRAAAGPWSVTIEQ